MTDQYEPDPRRSAESRRRFEEQLRRSRTGREQLPPRPSPVEAPTRQHDALDIPEPHRRSGDPRQSGLYLPWWAFVVVILAVAALTCGLWVYVLANRGDGVNASRPTPTPIFVVIIPTPTLEGAGGVQPGAQQPPAAAPTVTPTPIPLPETTPTAPALEIAVGSQVVIDGTEGVGLAVRQGPGLDYTYFFVGNDGEQFVIEDGPREADGYVWWYLTDPADENRAGWAVQNFLKPVQP